MARISTFIIVMIVFSMILVGGFGSFMASINSNYNITSYNESRIDAYDTLSDLSAQVEEVENKTKSLQSRSGIVDVLGGFFESAYDAVRISYNSMSVFNDMAAQAREDIPVLDRINVFYIGAITIVIIIILFVILRMVVKTNNI